MVTNTVNYVKILFSLMISVMIMFGSLMNTFEKYLPDFFRQLFRYGKFSYKKKSALVIEVPKSWFRHFYFYAAPLTLLSLLLVVRVYVFDVRPSVWILSVLDEIGGFYRTASVSPAQVLLALTLLTLQCVRRLYDTNYVSVFGKKSTMNVSHYLVGFIHYTGAVAAIFIEAPLFSISGNQYRTIHLTNLNVLDYLAALCFLWAWVHQYKASVILGNLRKNVKGEVVSQKYQLPEGDWFEYLSSPHSTAEILMYFSLTVILRNNVTWFYIFTWVVSNQVETILLSHWWYQDTFKEFPEKRKALIPLLY